jgi:hypothetical protein
VALSSDVVPNMNKGLRCPQFVSIKVFHLASVTLVLILLNHPYSFRLSFLVQERRVGVQPDAVG